MNAQETQSPSPKSVRDSPFIKESLNLLVVQDVAQNPYRLVMLDVGKE